MRNLTHKVKKYVSIHVCPCCEIQFIIDGYNTSLVLWMPLSMNNKYEIHDATRFFNQCSNIEMKCSKYCKQSFVCGVLFTRYWYAVFSICVEPVSIPDFMCTNTCNRHIFGALYSQKHHPPNMVKIRRSRIKNSLQYMCPC